MTDLPTFEADLSWATRGGCNGHPHPEWWWPVEASESYGGYGMARKVCNDCPVQAQCRAHGLAHEKFGMWGGLTPNERQNVKQGKPRTATRRTNKGQARARLLTVEEQEEIIRLHGDVPVSELAERFGVAKRSVYRVISRYFPISTDCGPGDPQARRSSVAEQIDAQGDATTSPAPEPPEKEVTRG